MKKRQSAIIPVLCIIPLIYWVFFTMMPRWVSPDTAPAAEFSTKRALLHVAEISKAPHYVGSENHDAVGNYLVKELGKLGLEAVVEEGTTLSDWGNLVKSKNIIARIKGSQPNRALLLLSHYDSAPHSSSHGAADDAAGIATILEGLRAFLHNTTPHKNDIIILFSDAEELGLNGAADFVTRNNWAKDVGLVLNFEARGTAGPSYMLMEVNNGNAAMIDAFSAAGTNYPVANSLMYSIYKMLPNDTDLTVFREQGKIQGFNFAFIDNHFNYHTAQDDIGHLDHRSLSHQSSYLMPLLHHFANADLANLNSPEDKIYFSTPLAFISYPFSCIFPMLIIAAVLFLFIIFIGIGKRTLIPSEIGKGFLNLFGALLVCGLIGFLGWKFLLSVYPQYNDILQGFTYNGHDYIIAFIFLALSVCFLFYFRNVSENLVMSQAVAPLFLWILVNTAMAIYLPGAAFFIIPVLCAILMMAFFVMTQKSNQFINLLLAIPALVLIVPFIWMFPIGLGLKILFGTMILAVLAFSLLLPLFGNLPNKSIWSLVMFLVSVGFFIHAHLNSDYQPGKAKPNSLVYLLDAQTDKAHWLTYDVNPDEWTKAYFGENPKPADAFNLLPLYSKYGSKFTASADAPVRAIPQPTIEFLLDSVIGTQHFYRIRITPNRKVNRYDIFANEKLVFHNLKANGAKPLGQKGSAYRRKNKKILSYYVVDNEPLEMQFSISKDAAFDMELLESSFDLQTNPLFSMAKRTASMMPTPFVLNDAVIVKTKIRPTPKLAQPIMLSPHDLPVTQVQTAVSDTIQDPDAEN
jgi:hypothetical protein